MNKTPNLSGLIEGNRQRTAKARERTYNALFNASTIEEARALFGPTKHDALYRAASRDPDLKARYDELSNQRDRSAIGRAGGEATRRRSQERSDILIEEVTFLLEAGATMDGILRSINKSYDAFEMAMYRAKRPDLLARVKKA